MVSKKAIKDKYRDTKKIFSKNWKLFKRSKLGILGIIIIAAFVLMAALAPVLTDRDPMKWTAPYEDMVKADRNWEKDDWILTGPSNIYGSPVVSGGEYRASTEMPNNEKGLYMIGDDADGNSKLYWTYPTNSLPFSKTLSISGNGTSEPAIYPINEISANENWDERVYFGTDKGVLYRATPDSDANTVINEDWSLDLNEEVSDSVSIEHTPLVVDVTENGENYIYVIVTTENSIHAVRDTRSGSTDPEMVWSQDFTGVIGNDTEYRLNQPDIFHNPKTDGLRDTKTIAITTDTGELIYLDAINDGEVIWNFNIEEVAGEEVKLTRPVVPFNLKKGDEKIQFFYTAGDDGRIYILPNNRTVSAEELGEDNIADVEQGAKLSVPDVRANGKGVWIIANKQGQGTIHYIERDELTTAPEERVASWQYEMTGDGVGKPTYFPKNDYVYAATDNNQIFCFQNSVEPGESHLTWTVGVGGSVRDVFLTQEGTTGDTLVVIHENGGIEGWGARGEFLAPLPPGKGERTGTRYLLGTDIQGRDIFSQLVYGSRIALLVGFAAAFFAVFLGTSVGITAGYLGGTADIILMRVVDVFLCMPGLALMIVFVALLGTSIWNIVFVIGVIGWPGIARVIRAQTLSLKERPFIDSARVSGASRARIMFRHIAPNVMPLTLLYMTFQVTGAILSEASLSYIGLGDPTSTSWGQMLYTLTRGSGATFTAWWWFFPPGLSITLLVLGFFFISRAFDEIINPRLRERR
ncbi:MAG: ABC transporter permease subunit [Thermoplasmatota archaeon]